MIKKQQPAEGKQWSEHLRGILNSGEKKANIKKPWIKKKKKGREIKPFGSAHWVDAVDNLIDRLFWFVLLPCSRQGSVWRFLHGYKEWSSPLSVILWCDLGSSAAELFFLEGSVWSMCECAWVCVRACVFTCVFQRKGTSSGLGPWNLFVLCSNIYSAASWGLNAREPSRLLLNEILFSLWSQDSAHR